MSKTPGPRDGGLSTKTRIQVGLGFGFLLMAWMKYLDGESSSARWGGVERFLVSQFGRAGFAWVLVGIGILFLLIAMPEVVRTIKRRNK